MNIGIRLHDTAPGTIWERLGFARDQGFSCYHLALSKLSPNFTMDDAPKWLDSEDYIEASRADMEAFDMKCVLLGCYLKLTTLDEEKLERTQEIYRAHLRYAGRMGYPVVGTETPPAKDYTADVHSVEALERFIRCVEPLVRDAEDAGVTLAIEPVAKDIVSTPERARYVLDALKSDRVGIILDAVNLLSRDNYTEADAIIARAIDLLGDRVCLLHMKDFTVDPSAFMTKACACGTGMMNYDRLLRFAKARSLPMTLENTTPDNAEATRLLLERLAEGLEA